MTKIEKCNYTEPIKGSAGNDQPAIGAMLGNHLEQAAVL
jgi:hypothetical protein